MQKTHCTGPRFARPVLAALYARRNMKGLIPLIIALTCSMNSYSFEEFKGNPACDRNQREMNKCASKRFEHYDKILNDLYRQQISFLGNTTERANSLKQAQKAWIKFRDLDCAYKAGKRENSGSIWPLVHLSCLAARTKTRASELESYVACRENGCPTGSI